MRACGPARASRWVPGAPTGCRRSPRALTARCWSGRSTSPTRSRRAFVQAAHDELGGLHILVNNAGVMLLGPVTDADTDEWRQMIAVNLLGLLYCTHAALPLIERSGGGDIVNLSSTAGRQADAGAAVYNMTKFGVHASRRRCARRRSTRESGSPPCARLRRHRAAGAQHEPAWCARRRSGRASRSARCCRPRTSPTRSCTRSRAPRTCA